MTDPTFAAAAVAFAESQADEARAALARLQAKDPKSDKIPEAKAIVKAAEAAVKAAEADLSNAEPPSLTGASGGTAHDATIVTT